MSPKKNPSSTLNMLRRKAEATLKTTSTQVKKMSLREIQHLVQELQVHQIELEMQNEELRRTQFDLQYARDRYVDLYDFAPVGFLTLDLRGHILEANLTACQLLEVERTTLLHQKLEAFVLAADQPVLRLHLQNITQRHIKNVSEVLRLKQNHTHFLVRLQSLFDNPSGEHAEPNIRMTLLDLTEQEQVKALQLEQSVWMNGVFDTAMDAIITVDEQQQIILFNKGAEAMFRCSSTEAIGKSIEQFIPQRFRTIHHEHVRRFMASGEIFRAMTGPGNVVARRADGEEFPIEASISQFELSGKTRLTFILRDITERLEAMEALAISEKQQREQAQMNAAILNALSAHIALIDVSSVILSVNEGWKRFAKANQFQGENLGIGSNYIEVCEQAYGDGFEEAQRIAEGLRAVLKGEQKSFIVDYPCHSPEEQYWVRMIITPISETENAGAVVMHLDVTERKQAQAALKNEQEFIATILDTADALVVVLDPQWRIVWFNRVCENLTGRTIGEMQEKFFLDLSVASGEDVQQFKNLLASFKKGGEFPKSFENAWLASDRQLRWISWSNTVIRDKQGGIENVIATGLDITSRKLAESEIRRLSTKNTLILNSVGEGIYGLDVHGQITFFNRAAERLTGWNAEDVLGKGVHQHLHHSKADGTPYALEECSIYSSLKDGTVHHQVPTEVFWRQDGTYFPTEYTSTPILGESREIVGAVVTFRDISERHRNENLLRGELQILEMISVEKSFKDIFERICRFVEELDRGSLCSIFLYDGMTLNVGAAPSLPASYVQSLEGMLSGPDGGSCGTAAYRKEQVIVSDIATDPLWKRYRTLALKLGLHACWSTPILSKSNTVLGVLGIYHRQPQSPKPHDFALMDLSCSLAGIAIERHVAQAALRTNQEELQALGGQLISAQEDERRRISRELHDDMNQRLAVLALNIQTAQRGLGASTPMYQTLEKLYDGVSTLSDDVRHLAYQLHPSILDDLGLEVALQSYLNDFSKWEGIPIAYISNKISLSLSLSPEIASCLYRLTQECLRNVSRHARATQVDVKLIEEDEGLRLSINDNGKGFKVQEKRTGQHGLGLIGMQERVRVVQGTYEVTSVLGQGTQISVWVPIGEVKSKK